MDGSDPIFDAARETDAGRSHAMEELDRDDPLSAARGIVRAIAAMGATYLFIAFVFMLIGA